MPTKIEKDALTGRETTGHEWDGLRELNTPLPKWWLYTFLATIVFAAVWFVLYPAVPLGRTHTEGILGYTQRGKVDADVAAAQARLAPVMDKIKALSTAEIRKDPQLFAVAVTAGKVAFGNNCAPCHGPSGQGQPGYPNLADDKWLWGGTLEDIQQTVTYGIRSGHPDARVSEMPRFGADGLLTAEQIGQVADYVLSLTGKAPAGTDLAKGAKVFAENCVACHGEKGEGSQQVGAPALSDGIWLYSGDRAAIVRQVTQPRHGVMPAWGLRLDEATIKSLTLYVHSLGGGK